jgi:hypothetical protein
MARSHWAAAFLFLISAPVVAQTPSIHERWAAPRTPWGDPDLQGVYASERERGVPMERPDRFAGRTLESITPAELETLGRERNAERRRNVEHQAFGGLSPQRFDLTPTRAWLLVDPPDGKMPPLTPLGEQRRQAYAARIARVPASAADSNLWYRCISIGVPRSMMPQPDGTPFRIVQAPGYVAIQFEMMHETRVIPLGSQPHVGDAVRMYMGDARGRWDGNSLVVETTNVQGEFQTTSAGGKDLRIVERFTPRPSGALDWTVTIDDPSGWTRPWTFAMPLAKAADDQGPLEYACHEGNYVLPNILSAARADERAAAQSWQAPRTADGHPDLEGVWSFATLTPLERPAELAGRASFTDDEAAAYEREVLARVNTDRRNATGALDLRGASVNEFWLERGPLARIDGRYSTSLIVDPPDGRLPPMTVAAEERRAQQARSRVGLADHRTLSLSERCLRSASGPPYVPGAPDSNLIRITDSRDHIAIVQEKYHETRMISLDERPHVSSAVRSWMGDARGHWDGDTLVVRTTNFIENLDQSNRLDRNLRLIERFTRVGTDTLRYEFTVDDPTVFTAPWTAVLPMRRTSEQLYEFACHEGNYSLPNMLRGARAEEVAQNSTPVAAPAAFNPAMARAWTAAGAAIGWLAPDRNENWVYTEIKPNAPTALPAFRFTALAGGALVGLPEPDIPFAVVLDGAPIADDALNGISRFVNLHALYLSRTPVTDAALSVDRLPAGLRVLYLGATKVTDAGVKQLARLEQLHTLRLSGTAVTDVGLTDVARLRNLQWLNLESTRVGDAGLRDLVGLARLRILHLGNTQVTDAGLPELAKLASLQIVRLGRSRVTTGGAAALQKSRPDLVLPPGPAPAAQ